MALSIEWRHRLEQWRRVLPGLIYRSLGEFELSGFTTKEHLRPEEAAQGAFQPMPPGTRWGGKWEYGWFRGGFSLPPEAEGKRIEVDPATGGDRLIFIGGRAVCHRNPTVTTSGVPGESYELLVEAYAGHGPTPVTTGPVPPGVVTVPEPPPEQQTVGRSTFGVRQDLVFQLWLDVETLFHLREALDPDSLRVVEIDAGLRDFTCIFDPELPREEMLGTALAARERLRPLLECTNGSTVPVMYAFGHGHLDVAWLWPLQETTRKAARTLAAQLTLAAEYPEHRFLHSQCELFQRVKDNYPELYGRVKQAVGDGHIIADGSTWVEMDTNVTGGEALIRQFVHGKRFYREEFGVETELLWLPDAFGYSGALPQILRGCGVKYFSTAKIFWNYNGGDPFPHNTFTWEGIDGSKVLVHLCNDYNSQTRPSDVVRRWRERRQKDGISTRLLPFGWGDGGGGPAREHLEFIRREANLEGCPIVRMAAPADYFRDLEERGVPAVNYVGELYYQAHRGTYTSQARTKRGNRKSELAFREAEMWGAAAGRLAGFAFASGEIDAAWKRVLTNQFHDVLPGSSIARVYEEAEAAFADAVRTAEAAADDARAALTEEDDALTVFSSLSWDRSVLVPLPEGWEGASGACGERLPAQELEGRRFAEVGVPSCGWTTLRPGAAAAAGDGAIAGERTLENDLLRVEFDDRGEISSIADKESGRDLAAGPCNALRMYKDVPTAWDAWDLDSVYPLTPVELPEPAEFEVVSAGPLVGVLRIRRRLNQSELVQDVVLRRAGRRVEFRTTIDWHETHKLLKVNFPVDLHADEGIHEIQFGHIRRPNHKSRPYDADRFEVCSHRWTALAEEGRGFAVLNDCKYGVNVDGNSINLTLLKSPVAPDMNADKGRQEFTYAFYAWNGALAESRLVREAYELNCPVTAAPGSAGEKALFSVDAPNVVIDTVKPAEDGSGDVVVRLYESMRTATRCTLCTTLPVGGAEQTNMLEEEGEAVAVHDGSIALDFRPFEIKTVRLKA
jgi:alpha-mannosidase